MNGVSCRPWAFLALTGLGRLLEKMVVSPRSLALSGESARPDCEGWWEAAPSAEGGGLEVQGCQQGSEKGGEAVC